MSILVRQTQLLILGNVYRTMLTTSKQRTRSLAQIAQIAQSLKMLKMLLGELGAENVVFAPKLLKLASGALECSKCSKLKIDMRQSIFAILGLKVKKKKKTNKIEHFGYGNNLVDLSRV